MEAGEIFLEFRLDFHFWADSLQLGMKKFDADLNSPAVKRQVLKDLEGGERAGVEGTPTLYIDGQRYNGADLILATIKPVIDEQMKKKSSARLRACSVEIRLDVPRVT